MSRVGIRLVVACALTLLSLVAVWPAFHEPVQWTPDALYYEARVLEFRGASDQAAIDKVFEGPISASLRARDPLKTGDPEWVAYNEPFYERRVAVPLAASLVYPELGERSILDISLVGYVAAILALFGLLLIRFPLAIATLVTTATIFLPALTKHSAYPLTDSVGLALEIGALAAAMLALERGLRWLPLWVATILVLSFTRDSTWIPILAVGWCAFRYRSRAAVALFAAGVAAAVPALLLFTVPVRDLLALLVNGSQPSADTSWTFILRHYPGAVVSLIRDNVGFVRRGEWYTGFYLVGGVLFLLGFAWRSARRSVETSLMSAAAIAGLLYVLAAPVFSAFRLELVFVPCAAFGLAMVAERIAAGVRERNTTREALLPLPARVRRS